MADTQTPNLLLTNQTEGGNDNTWGIKVDDNFEQIDDVLGNTTSITTTGGATTLTDEQELVANIVVDGTLASNATINFSGRGGFWIVANDTEGDFTLTVKVTGETGIQIAQGTATVVWCDGDDIRQGVPTAELASDTSPRLSADLDANGFSIGFDDATGITDDDGNEQVRFQKTASAVNQIDVTNAATGNAPSLAATGDDTNIDLSLAGKGTGGVVASFKQATGLGLKDSDSSHDLRLKTSSNLTAIRTLDFVTGDADRSLTLQGDAVLPAGTVLVIGNVMVEPQGYLTPSSGTPIITADVAAATSVYYEPFRGNMVPLPISSLIQLKTFSALQLQLNNPNHVAGTLYDVFLDWSGSEVRIGTGPAWTTSTAGSGARGTGAGTTQLTRTNGLWVNTVEVSARNGSSTYTIAAGAGLYVGTIMIGGTAGQVNCHRAWGQSRQWGVWNAYNRHPLYLKAGDSTASWAYTSGTFRASNNDSDNSLTVLQGLAEEIYDVEFTQNRTGAGSASTVQFLIGIGWNSTTTTSGRQGRSADTDDSTEGGNNLGAGNAVARHIQPPSLGANVVTALESGNSANHVIYGSEDNMLLLARWRG